MEREIKLTLSKEGLEDFKKQIEDYKESLRERTDLFTSYLGSEMEAQAQANYSVALGDHISTDGLSYIATSPNVTVTSKFRGSTKRGVSRGKVVAKGSEVAFVEFGAGVTMNSGSSHPLSEQLGMTIGSYGNHKGLRPKWFWRDSAGTLMSSIGTPASRALYRAKTDTQSKIKEIARRAFQ